jgi:hypothetical protein
MFATFHVMMEKLNAVISNLTTLNENLHGAEANGEVT